MKYWRKKMADRRNKGSRKQEILRRAQEMKWDEAPPQPNFHNRDVNEVNGIKDGGKRQTEIPTTIATPPDLIDLGVDSPQPNNFKCGNDHQELQEVDLTKLPAEVSTARKTRLFARRSEVASKVFCHESTI